MLFLTILTLFLLACCFSAVWPSIRPLRRRDDGSHPATGRPAAAAVPVSRPESLEGVLVAQLVGGEITRAQYLRAIERIAARDDERHPLTIPPDAGSDAAQ